MASHRPAGRPRRVVLLYNSETGEVLDFFIEDGMEAILVVDAVPSIAADPDRCGRGGERGHVSDH
jgi:hypothetical protein